MKAKLSKVAGDNNIGDYIPEGYWVSGHCQTFPKANEEFVINRIYAGSEEHDGAEEISLDSIDYVIANLNGFIMICGEELWYLNLNEC